MKALAPPPAPTWIDEGDVSQLLDLAGAIEVLRDTYRTAASGEAVVMPRAHAPWDGGLVHAVGGVIPGAGVAGVKAWVWTPPGAQPIVTVFSAEDGKLRGFVAAMGLGQLRTAATAAIGTDHLAAPDAASLAIIGTGRQALSQVLAVCAVRPITSVRVFGRDPGRRGDFAARVAAVAPVRVSEHDRVEDAVAGADVITTVTRAREPFLRGSDLQPGVHVNAVGSIVATSAELDTDAIRRADVVVVDSRAQARDDAGDLRAAAALGVLSWPDVLELGRLGPPPAPGRTHAGQITVLRTVGVGIADVALADAVLRRRDQRAVTSAEVGDNRNGARDAT